jgi:hypothetical protein
MPRLIQVNTLEDLRGRVALQVGDVLSLPAIGVTGATDIVEILGPFVPGVVGTNGEVLSPAAVPGFVMIFARGAGTAEVDVFAGDPFRGAQKTSLCISVIADA